MKEAPGATAPERDSLACLPVPPHCVIREGAEFIVIDKPAGWVVHGGDPDRSGDLVSRLAARFARLGEPTYIAVHQRLDKDASGVIVFLRSRSLNQLVSGDFAAHRVERLYRAVVRGALAGEGRFDDRLTAGADGRSRIVAKGGQRAEARYRVIDRVGPRALVELAPKTGRTHQLRAQLAHRGAPICGDRLYGGETAPRLMLHAISIGIPSIGLRSLSPEPVAFGRWLAEGKIELPPTDSVERALAVAASRRYGLDSSAYRLVDDAADGFPGVTVDRYGRFAVLSTSTRKARSRCSELAGQLVRMGFDGVYAKHRARGDLRRMSAEELALPDPVAGHAAPDPLWVEEGALRFSVHLGDGLSTGLFLDQRENRARLRALAREARILNLFCYTCGFTVAAAAGGAAATVSVDLSKKALDRGGRNLEANGLAGPEHRLLRADALEFLSRARRRGDRFDWIVIDPPSFATTPKGAFSVERQYPALVRDALRLVTPGGGLLAVTNHKKTSRSRLRRILHRAAAEAGRSVAQMKDLPMPDDHPHRPGGHEPTKSVLVTIR